MSDSIDGNGPKNPSRLRRTKALIASLSATSRVQTVAMTFDDGPHGTLTPKLLDLLGRCHIKATFFVVGKHVVAHPEVVARAAEEGHEIGNHSWSHPDFRTMSDDGVRQQLRDAEHAIADATNKTPTVMRPPFGSISDRQKDWILREFGYRTIMWDVDSLDWTRPGPAKICARITAGARSGAIVLCHDNCPETLDAMEATLTQLSHKGCKFATISELFDAEPFQPPAAFRAGLMRSLRMFGLPFTRAAGSRGTWAD